MPRYFKKLWERKTGKNTKENEYKRQKRKRKTKT